MGTKNKNDMYVLFLFDSLKHDLKGLCLYREFYLTYLKEKINWPGKSISSLCEDGLVMKGFMGLQEFIEKYPLIGNKIRNKKSGFYVNINNISTLRAARTVKPKPVAEFIFPAVATTEVKCGPVDITAVANATEIVFDNNIPF